MEDVPEPIPRPSDSYFHGRVQRAQLARGGRDRAPGRRGVVPGRASPNGEGRQVAAGRLGGRPLPERAEFRAQDEGILGRRLAGSECESCGLEEGGCKLIPILIPHTKH